MRFYPAFLEPAPGGGGFGVFFADLPGCISGGATAQVAALNAAEAGGEGDLVRIMVPVEVPGRAVRANITLDEELLRRLRCRARADGNSRSGFIAEAVRARLAERARRG